MSNTTGNLFPAILRILSNFVIKKTYKRLNETNQLPFAFYFKFTKEISIAALFFF